MNYRMTKNKETGMFEVLEIETDQIVFQSISYEDASATYKRLNHDKCGFEGFTPTFFLKTAGKKLLDTF